MVEDYDKTVFVRHKKVVKEILWKELGANMQVFWVADRPEADVVLDPNSILSGVGFLEAFDEEIDKEYCFLPKYSEERMQILQKNLSDIGLVIDLEYTEKGVVFSKVKEQLETQRVAFLFGLSLTYGKWEIKEGDLKSVKIQFGLFGQYLQKREVLDMCVETLQKGGVFLTKDVQESTDGFVYQIVVGDYELLHLWTNAYQRIENIEKISKYEYALEAKIKLLEYLRHSDLVNDKKLDDLEHATVKLLTKM